MGYRYTRLSLHSGLAAIARAAVVPFFFALTALFVALQPVKSGIGLSLARKHLHLCTHVCCVVWHVSTVRCVLLLDLAGITEVQWARCLFMTSQNVRHSRT